MQNIYSWNYIYVTNSRFWFLHFDENGLASTLQNLELLANKLCLISTERKINKASFNRLLENNSSVTNDNNIRLQIG